VNKGRYGVLNIEGGLFILVLKGDSDYSALGDVCPSRPGLLAWLGWNFCPWRFDAGVSELMLCDTVVVPCSAHR